MKIGQGNKHSYMAPMPSVGRIVHYKTRDSADGVFPPTNFAAIITDVTDPETVSLATFGKSGLRFELDVKQGNEPGQWNWPERV